MLTMLALLLTDPPAVTPTMSDRPQLICRQGEKETGSHRRTGKRCKTAEEWAKEDEESARLSPSARITEGQGDSLTRSSPH